MVDRALYLKARDLADGGRVSIDEDTDRSIYLTVQGEHDVYKVRLNRDHTFACTCPYATLRGLPKGALCSHVVAAILFTSRSA